MIKKLILIVAASTFFSAYANEKIIFSLDAVKKSSENYCEAWFTILSNEDRVNITYLQNELAVLERDGSIFNRKTIAFERIKPKKTNTESILISLKAPCDAIGAFKYLRTRVVQVDGEHMDNESKGIVYDWTRVESKVKNIKFIK